MRRDIKKGREGGGREGGGGWGGGHAAKIEVLLFAWTKWKD